MNINRMHAKDKIFTLEKIIKKDGRTAVSTSRRPQILFTKSDQHSPFVIK